MAKGGFRGGMPGMGGGNMGQLLQQAQKMQREVERVQEEIKNSTIDATSGGGVVKVTIDGNHVPVGSETLYIINAYRRIHEVAAALCFAGMRADAPADNGERICLLDNTNSCLIVAVLNGAQICLDIYIVRARLYAGCDTVRIVVRKELLQPDLAVARKSRA